MVPSISVRILGPLFNFRSRLQSPRSLNQMYPSSNAIPTTSLPIPPPRRHETSAFSLRQLPHC